MMIHYSLEHTQSNISFLFSVFVDAVTGGNTATFTFNDDAVARAYDIRVRIK